MKPELKPKPEFKIESVEEFKARGGSVQKATFDEAYRQVRHFTAMGRVAAASREVARKAKKARLENAQSKTA